MVARSVFFRHCRPPFGWDSWAMISMVIRPPCLDTAIRKRMPVVYAAIPSHFWMDRLRPDFVTPNKSLSRAAPGGVWSGQNSKPLVEDVQMRTRMTALLIAIAVSGPAAFAQKTCGMQCGQERWAIKTMTDSQADAVGNTPIEETTITKLIGQVAPAKLTDNRAPGEMKRYHFTALIVGWKIEAKTAAENFGLTASASKSVPDHDFHIVIADPDNP